MLKLSCMVVLGGGLGAALRYWIAIALSRFCASFPWDTLTANILACFILGVFVGFCEDSSGRLVASQEISLLFVTGFCGGLSTFSSFLFQTFGYLRSGNFSAAVLNVVLSFWICFALLLLGYFCGEKFHKAFPSLRSKVEAPLK